MITIKPDFFDTFRCIADKCTDSCCIGWEIDVDGAALEKYNTLDNSLGEEIRSCIVSAEGGGKCFELSEKERCPFLDERSLCRIISEQGEGYLCEICKEHPRFYEWFHGVTECGLGLCCEEVCRILLSSEKPFSLVEENDGEEVPVETDEQIEEFEAYEDIYDLRECLFHLLYTENMTFDEKIKEIIFTIEEFCGEKIVVRDYEELLELYRKTEPINDEWTAYINELTEKFFVITGDLSKTFKEMGGEELYPRILAYTLYRHLSKAVFDYRIGERVKFAIESVSFIRLCDARVYLEKGELTLKDRINNLKNWSKQIEYSEENTDLLIYGEE